MGIDLDMVKELSPCYVYDAGAIEAACRELAEALPQFGFLYSVKANPFAPVVRTAAACGLGADASSPAEVDIAAACGTLPEDIYYSAPGKTEGDLRRTLGKCTVIVDSLGELGRIERIAAEADTEAEVGLRIHPAFGLGGAGGPSKFGIDVSQAGELAGTLAACPHVRVAGIHVHLRSQVLDADAIGRYWADIMRLALDLRGQPGLELRFVNFGSGIGTVYDEARESPVDLAKLRRYAEEAAKLNEDAGARLLVETGRFVTCRAGRFYTPVVDRKESGGKTYLVVRSGLNGFARPAMANLVGLAARGGEPAPMEPLYTGPHAFEVRVLGDAPDIETVDVMGSLCTAMDVLAAGVRVRRAQVGDIVEVTNAGSYARTLSPLAFASFDPPGEYLLDRLGNLISE